jgi:hypothetical protein
MGGHFGAPHVLECGFERPELGGSESVVRRPGARAKLGRMGIIRRLLGDRSGKGPVSLLKPGDPAPDFEVQDHQGRTVRLRDFRGKRVVLWFYPKADTPG